LATIQDIMCVAVAVVRTFEVDVHAWPVVCVTQQAFLRTDEANQCGGAQALVARPAAAMNRAY
jgi:hypothetical protein